MNPTAFARLLAISVTSLFSLANVADAADPWPRFRGPTDNGIASTTVAPTIWDRQTNIAWRTELPGQGWSSPVIGDAVVYVSAAIPRSDDPARDYDLALILVSVDSGETMVTTDLLLRHKVRFSLDFDDQVLF